ncbi:hypothetical protein TRFO_24318 [Tritrichomonas foetus]|uniref:Uncharacterized protein n=1 Tax=Tritrichomonas foetus TaxID=1144522 RepID=A0A1J4K7H3_9EUKA|nr:hypothetical protein TRFO_24318 [Tritrichomonas foetus]|eukprot:OHT07433.1 hypothetical protein TRFO_24318 [Tritrichomonas foetus]
MAAKKPFFRFSLDETSLHNFFSTVEERLSQYDSLFEQQNDKINALNSQIKIQNEKISQNEKLKDDIKDLAAKIETLENAVNEKNHTIQSISEKILLFEKSLIQNNEKIEEISQNVKNEEIKTKNELIKMKSEITNETNQNLNKNIEEIKIHMNELIKKSDEHFQKQFSEVNQIFSEFQNNLKSNQEKISCNEQKTAYNRKSIDALNKSFLSLTSNSKFGKSTEENLEIVASNLVSQISSLFDQNSELKEKISKFEENFNKPFSIKSPEPDLEHLQLRPDCQFDIDQPPILPKLHKFNSISQCVDYIYELIPILQSFLNALYENVNHRRLKSIDKERSLAEIKYEIADIRSSLTNVATRDDLNMIMRRKIVTQPEVDLNRGINAVKCIACGRELSTTMNSVHNTFPDDNPSKRIGTAVNGGARRFNVGIIENPRSARSYHNPPLRKVQTPK